MCWKFSTASIHAVSAFDGSLCEYGASRYRYHWAAAIANAKFPRSETLSPGLNQVFKMEIPVDTTPRASKTHWLRR